LLEPCAATSCTHGSEGAPAQQCVGVTRLVIGKGGKTAVATLVERTSRFVILAPLTGRASLHVGDAVIAATHGLPAQIRRSLTWDCGAEMARHASITATGLPVFFAHPHSPLGAGQQREPEPDRAGVLPERHTDLIGSGLSGDGGFRYQRPTP